MDLNRCEESPACFARLSETFARLVDRAERLSVGRCPYRNGYDGCTARFGCVNQRDAQWRGPLPLCRPDGPLHHHRA